MAQTNSLDFRQWISTSKFADMIDYDKKTGLMGHSMGGQATHRSANNADAVTMYNIGAAVALHPVYVAGSSNVPIIYGTGSNDTYVPPSSVKPQYDATHGVAKVYANIEVRARRKSERVRERERERERAPIKLRNMLTTSTLSISISSCQSVLLYVRAQLTLSPTQFPQIAGQTTPRHSSTATCPTSKKGATKSLAVDRIPCAQEIRQFRW